MKIYVYFQLNGVAVFLLRLFIFQKVFITCYPLILSASGQSDSVHQRIILWLGNATAPSSHKCSQTM